MSLAALERAQLLSRGSTPEERRQYVEQLLTLPAYKDPQLTTYFAGSISLHFAEYEDLQDQSVDAVLDLCEDEDEKTRISGIKALARIGKVEPRWVKGNTGVLLQLLESPPSEVKHVRQALYDLLDVSAADVLSVLADDCKGAEEETGASRRNILDFLQSAKEKRAAILESGKNVKAEKVFADGFYKVMETTAIAETRQILGLLLPLSTISGKNATGQATGRFAKALTRCLHSGSSVGLTTPLLRLWAELDKRNARLDPRWTLYFLADHGAAVVSLVAEKDDELARQVLLSPVRDIRQLKRALDERASGDLDERRLVAAFAQTVLNAALRFTSQPSAMEMALYPVYIAVTSNRSTRDAVRDSSLRRALDDLQHRAHQRKRDARDEEGEKLWRNIRDMAETMADRTLVPIDITPTWMSRQEPNPRETEKARPSRIARSSTSPKRDTQETESRRSGESSKRCVERPSQEEKPATVKPTTDEPIKPTVSSHKAPSPKPPPQRTEPDPPKPAVSAPSLAQKKEEKPLTPPAATPTPTNGLSILARAKQPTTQPPSATPAPSSSGLRIRARASQPVASPMPQAGSSTATQGSAAQTTIASQGLSIRSAASKTPVEASKGSLLSRLGNGDGKRLREPDPDQPSPSSVNTPPAPRSLASRFGVPVDTAKRPRTDPAETTTTPARGTSLVDRMSRRPLSTPQPPRATDSPTFNIKNRASVGTPKQTQSAQSPAVATPQNAVADDGIIRKGRGFASRQ